MTSSRNSRDYSLSRGKEEGVGSEVLKGLKTSYVFEIFVYRQALKTYARQDTQDIATWQSDNAW